MTKLPPEVYFHIIKDVADLVQTEDPEHVQHKLAPLAQVCKNWVEDVESKTFEKIQKVVNQSPDDFNQTFTQVFSDHARRRALRELTVIISFEHAEPEQHHQQFFRVISHLFRELKSWEENFDREFMTNKPLKLTIGFYTVTTAMPMLAELYPSLRPLELGSLPVLQRVTVFSSANIGCSFMDPKTRFQLAGLMPNLKSLVITLCDPGEGRPTTRDQHRQAVIDGLKLIQANLPNLITLKLINNQFGPENHNFDSEHLLNEEGVDEFSTAVRQFSQNGVLQNLVLKGFPICDHLFYDHVNADGYDDTSIWPSLRSFYISSGIVSSSSEWYYTGNPMEAGVFWYDFEGSDKTGFRSLDLAIAATAQDIMTLPMRENLPRHQWRTQPDPVVFDSLPIELASAVHRMPLLENGYFVMRVKGETSRRIRLLCAAEGHPLKQTPYASCTPTDPAFLETREPESAVEASPDVGSRRWLVTTDRDVQWVVPNGLRYEMTQWAGVGNVRIEKLTDVCEYEHDRENWKWLF